MIPRVDPRKLVRIARWEVSKSVGSMGRRTLVVGAAVVVLGALLAPVVVQSGVDLDQGLYRVGVEEESRYHNVVEKNDQFVAREPSVAALRNGRIDVIVRSGVVLHHSSPKGRAAYAAFRSAVDDHNDDLMADEVLAGGDRAAAFPVRIQLLYESRATTFGTGNGGGGPAGSGGSGGDGGPGGPASGGGGLGGGGDGRLPVPRIGSSLGGSAVGPPGDISPPFPYGSLILAFLFIVPMNFVIQAYGSTIMDERINRRGELMLVAPVTPGSIVAGKTLPYLAALLLVTLAIAILIGGGVLSVAAVVPIAVLFLAATFVGAMFARSFKELTFVTLSISVFLTSYSFVPAIFAEITPIALISPLTLVVWDLQGDGATLAQYAFSTGPIYLSSLVLFVLGAGVYREEDMFSQRPVHLKALDAFAARIGSKRHVLALSAVFIPFVFAAELLVVALLFALPVGLSLPVLLAVVALVEELAKSAHVYAGFTHARYDRSLRTAVVVGALSGAGFFLGEKLTLVVQVIGLPDLALGRAAFPSAAGLEPGPLVAAGLLLAPLALHVVTAAISAAGARRSARAYLVALGGAVTVHVTYNLAVIGVIGGV